MPPAPSDDAALHTLLQHARQHQEQTSAARTAFSLGAVHARKDASRLTALAVDSRTQRLFLGLSTGCVHCCVCDIFYSRDPAGLVHVLSCDRCKCWFWHCASDLCLICCVPEQGALPAKPKAQASAATRLTLPGCDITYTCFDKSLPSTLKPCCSGATTHPLYTS